ncbi:MAG: hypothetical protein DMG07_28665, partial [Acidobacteria bacterium]
APRSSGSNNRFEFPTTGASADGNALLLAIDDILLPLRYNLCYYLTRPEIHPEPVLTPSRENPTAPDFLAAHFYGAVLEDQGKFRMWYYALSAGDKPSDLREGPVCYAESEDGIRWVKPNLGQVDFRGSRANNAIQLPDARIEGVEVIRDDDHGRTWTIRTATSADGLHWTARPDFAMTWFIEQASFIRHNGLYLVYGQSHPFGEGGAVRGRQGYVWVSPDFQRWLPALGEAFVLPEPANPADRGSTKPYDQVHLGVGAASFGSVAVGLYGMWHERGWGAGGTSCDLGLVVSNDGLHFREPVKGFVYVSSDKSRATPLPGKDYPTILCQANGIVNVGGETRIYHGRWRNAEYGKRLLRRDRAGPAAPRPLGRGGAGAEGDGGGAMVGAAAGPGRRLPRRRQRRGGARHERRARRRAVPGPRRLLGYGERGAGDRFRPRLRGELAARTRVAGGPNRPAAHPDQEGGFRRAAPLRGQPRLRDAAVTVVHPEKYSDNPVVRRGPAGSVDECHIPWVTIGRSGDPASCRPPQRSFRSPGSRSRVA